MGADLFFLLKRALTYFYILAVACDARVLFFQMIWEVGMRAFVFNGVDFGGLCRAKVLEEGPLVVRPVTTGVPGRAGEAIVDCSILPKEMRVRVFLDPVYKMEKAEIESLRHKLYAALLTTKGTTLQHEENYLYRDVLCTDAKTWNALAQYGSCEIVFTLFDPIAYTRVKRIETSQVFSVGGTWETCPEVRVVCAEGSQVGVGTTDGQGAVTVEGTFAAGDVLELNFEHETARLNGVDISSGIALSSDFFTLTPGTCHLVFTGAQSHTVSFFERWV